MEVLAMKRNILLVSIVSVLIIAIVIPVTMATATGKLEFFELGDGISERANLNKIYSIESFSNDKIQIIYEMSRNVNDGFADIYKDSSGNDYIYRDGKLTGFYSNEIKSPVIDCTPIGQDFAIKVATKALYKFTDNVDEYIVRDVEEKENYGQYFISVARKIGDIFTEEYAVVSVMYDGSIKSVAIYNDGKFDNVSENLVKGITSETLKAYALSEMQLIYPDDGNKFEIRDYCLEEDESGFFITIYGNIGTRVESVRYDLEK